MTTPRNLPASIQGRLRNLAVARGEPAAVLYTRYALERLLYRLSVSPHRTRFVLKGAMLFVLWTGAPHRPTVDLDLLGFGTSDGERIAAVFHELCTLDVADDGLVFDAASVRVEPVREEEEYQGLRTRLRGQLGGMRLELKVDIGFGDAVTPAAVEAEYPALLGGPRARLLTYPRETVIAEKYQAVVALGLGNSRMKDFFDIWQLAEQYPFDGPTLARAIAATFARRTTRLPERPPPALTEVYWLRPEVAERWDSFLARVGGQDERVGLDAVADRLQSFLMPPTAALAAGQPFAATWPAGGPWTEQVGSEAPVRQ